MNTVDTDKKNLLILGASSEVGLDFIRRAYGSYDVIAAHCCRGASKLASLREETGADIRTLSADFTSGEETDLFVEKLKEDYPSFSHIVHLPAGRLSHLKFHKTSWESYEKDLSVGLGSAVKILSAYLPGMAKERSGRVVFLLSSVTANESPGYLCSYTSGKFALLGLMKSLSAEYSSKNVHINAVSPYMMDTDFLSGIPEAVVSHMMESNPFGKPVAAADVTDMIEFLLSDKSDALYGQNLLVKGRP